MNKTIIILMLLAIPYCAYGQYNNYNLNSYTNPDFKRKSLDIFFNSAGDFEKNNQFNNNALQGNTTVQFNSIRNSTKIQETVSFGITGLISNTKNEDIYFNKLRNNSVGLNFNQKAHHYISKKHFIEVSPRADIQYKYSKATANHAEVVDKRENTFRTELEVDLGYGLGRLENVTDARQAIYILDDLQDKGILKKTLTSKEINELARQMAIVKNKRQFDAREKAIDELTFINNYLISQNYIDSVNTAEYFLSLNDYWNNGDKVMREAGYRFKFGVAPTYIFQQLSDKRNQLDESNNLYKNYTKNIDTKWGGTLYIDYTKETPINLKFQRSFNIGARNGLYRWRNRESNEFLQHTYMRLAYGYYANTRTYFEAALNEHFYWNHTPNSSIVPKLNTLSSDTSLDFKGYYFISGQLRIFGSFSMIYSYYREIEPNQTNYNKYPHTKFEFGLQYSIF